MKLFLASLGTETNTFSPFPTGFDNFKETYLVRAGNHGNEPFLFAVPLVLWRRQASKHGWSVVESLCTFAQPAGLTTRSVYESFRSEILRDLKKAFPVDMVLLSLHGAMVANGYDDCEGDLLAHIRSLVGPKVPIGVELDLHCHLTQQMIKNSTVIVTFKEYPHTDSAERATELFQIMAETCHGNVKPQMSFYDCNMIGIYHTTSEPMKSFVDEVRQLEQKKGILSISIVHGFPWGDVSEMGTGILIVTDNEPQKGENLSKILGEQFFQLRNKVFPDYKTIDQAIENISIYKDGPIILADVADNPGGGAPGDSTFILKALVNHQIKNAAVACIWDPIAVAVASEAGEGSQLTLRLGGKMGISSGTPIDLNVKVTKVVPDAVQTFGSGKDQSVSKMGASVALYSNEIDIVVNSVRTQTLGADAFSNLGIDPKTKQVLVVKSMQHFFAAFSQFSKKIFYVDSPGALISNFRKIPYKKVNLTKWPLKKSP